MKRWDLALLGAAVVCGGGFLASLDHLWPVADLDLEMAPRKLYAIAEDHQSLVESKLRDWDWSNQVSLDERALSWLERTRGPYEVRRFLRSGLPVYLHEIQFKRRGVPETITFWIHPETGLAGWSRTLEDDAPGDRIDSSAALGVASALVREHLAIDLSQWELKRHESRFLSERTDNAFVFERAVEPGSNVRERLTLEVAGRLVREVHRIVVVPPSYLREDRKSHYPELFTQSIALAIFASMGVMAFLYKIWGLKRGLVGLRTPLVGSGVILACLAISRLLREHRLFELWDPMGPRWMAAIRVLLTGAINDLLPAIMVFSFLAASDALDREAPRHRGIALRNFLMLRWIHVDVGHASMRGFLLGWIAGGVLALSSWLLSRMDGSLIELQPRGFFFHGINSFHPTLLLGFFFLQIALVEELGYRHFAGNGLLRIHGGRIVAALVPALVYGAVHAGLDFLPPAQPWWARIIPITLVGFMWGLAFIRWDALTVVLSHWACDLFLFNRVRLQSEDPWVRLSAVACIALPLLPAAVSVGYRLWERFNHKDDPESWAEDPDFEGYDPGTDPGLPEGEGGEDSSTDSVRTGDRK
jgi:hypothetical protein